jgi:hypothetical protein
VNSLNASYATDKKLCEHFNSRLTAGMCETKLEAFVKKWILCICVGVQGVMVAKNTKPPYVGMKSIVLQG